jgi:hypothetical protein
MRMKKLFASLILLAATLAMAGSASAVVLTGTTYNIYLQGEVSGNAFAAATVFDDAPAFTTRAGVVLALSESETALEGTNSHISLNLSADGDLFPAFNEGAYFGVGTFGGVIDLATTVTLYDARVTVRDLGGNVLFASDNVADFAVNNPPWDGSFPSPDTIFLIGGIGGQGASNITFDFYVNEVPEPGSVLLCGLGLLAIVTVCRQRRFKA